MQWRMLCLSLSRPQSLQSNRAQIPHAAPQHTRLHGALPGRINKQSSCPCCCRLEAKREENEQKARRLAEKFADLKKAAEAANQAKEQAWERAKEAGTSAEQCGLVLRAQPCPGLGSVGVRHDMWLVQRA